MLLLLLLLMLMLILGNRLPMLLLLKQGFLLLLLLLLVLVLVGTGTVKLLGPPSPHAAWHDADCSVDSSLSTLRPMEVMRAISSVALISRLSNRST